MFFSRLSVAFVQDTPDSSSEPQEGRSRILAGSLFLMFLFLLLRRGRLLWQPLWWDEGYSVYFATEPLARMVQLTAKDIHPPLYYALLHVWLLVWGDASPLALRTFSTLIGIAAAPAIWWLAYTLFPRRTRLPWLAAVLLAISPMHVFYSQEVRMYGLEMLLGVLATGLFWRLQTRQAGRGTLLAYVLVSAGLLYTEYYAGFLLLAHFLWALAVHLGPQTRRPAPAPVAPGAPLPRVPAPGGSQQDPPRGERRPILVRLGLAALGIGLLYAPWLLYAGPKLIPYVSQKIIADADRPLSLIVYLARHGLAFTAGHVAPAESWLDWLRWTGPAAVLLLVAGGLVRNRRLHPGGPTAFLLTNLVVPTLIGFGLNLRLPFFPEGGERVLLFVLPAFLLLCAAGVDRVWTARAGTFRWWLSALGGAGLLAAAGAGLIAFYTTPRYADHDYRPLIRQVVQQGRDEDTVFAVFPWQVGYWRAYAPVWGRGPLVGPWPMLSPSPAWNEKVADSLNQALARGRLWFPAHQSLGAILETAVEDYLQDPAGGGAVNLDNRWYGSATRLTGWVKAKAVETTPRSERLGPVELAGAGLAPAQVRAANEAIQVRLLWAPAAETPRWRVSLRLVDAAGRVWSNHDYAPLGTWATTSDPPLAEQVGLLVPVGTPPGAYGVEVGVGPEEEAQPLFPVEGGAVGQVTVPVGQVTVSAADAPQPVARLPMQQPLARPKVRGPVRFLGVSGLAEPILAGTELEVSLFVEKASGAGADAWPHLFVELRTRSGERVAGWTGWPLPGAPLDSWPVGSLMRLPVAFDLPPHLEAGAYEVAAGLAAGDRVSTEPVLLGQVEVERRPAYFTRPTPQHVLDPPPQFGSHASLIGYHLSEEARAITLTLYWQVQQTLLPPHQVFVHLVDATGQTIAQDDRVPGAFNGQAAPTGTWLPGEFITDVHRIPLPEGASPPLRLYVGLYDPRTGVRLPVSQAGEMIGDAWLLP